MKSFFICVAMAAWSLVKWINRSLWFRAGRLLLKGKEKKSRKQGNSTEQETNGRSASEMWSDRGQWLTCLQRELWSNPFRPCPEILSWGGDWRSVWCRSVAVQVELVGCELHINKHVWSRADDTCLHTCGHAHSGLTSDICRRFTSSYLTTATEVWSHMTESEMSGVWETWRWEEQKLLRSRRGGGGGEEGERRRRGGQEEDGKDRRRRRGGVGGGGGGGVFPEWWCLLYGGL